MSPHLDVLRVGRVWVAGGVVRIAACTRELAVACPDCGCGSARVHSRYDRTLADAAQIHKTHREVIGERAARDHAALRPLPPTPCLVAERHLWPVGKGCLVAFGGNLYSVPARRVRPCQLVEIRATKSQVMLHSTAPDGSGQTRGRAGLNTGIKAPERRQASTLHGGPCTAVLGLTDELLELPELDHHQVVIDADTRLVVVVGQPLPGNRNDRKAWEESGAKVAIGRTLTIADGGCPSTGLVMPQRRRKGEDLPDWKDCRLKGDGVHHAMLGIARMHNLTLAG
jgi:hypothetical protein